MSISIEVLEKIYSENPPDSVFVETGSCYGDTIEAALKVGFKQVRSIEFGINLYNGCIHKFRNCDNVKLYNGSSGLILHNVCEDIEKNIVFWLDAHYSGGDTALAESVCPLYEELDQIKKLSKNTHTILIDDMRDVYSGYMRVDLPTLQKKIMEINPNYKLSFLHGYVQNDILMASIR